MDEGDAEGWETGIVLSLGRAGQSYTRRLRGPRSYTILRDPTLFYKILHNSTRSYTILQDPTQFYKILHNPTQPFAHICMSQNPTALPQSNISLQFTSNLPKLAEKLRFT